MAADFLTKAFMTMKIYLRSIFFANKEGKLSYYIEYNNNKGVKIHG